MSEHCECHGSNPPYATSCCNSTCECRSSGSALASVHDAALGCVEYVKKSLGIELDFTPDTLPILDHYLREAGANVASQAETTHLLATVAGCYFGEVICRLFPVAWDVSEADAENWCIHTNDDQIIIFPVQMALVAMQGPSAEADLSPLCLHDPLRSQLAERLSMLPDVDEQQYVALSTRIEVLEIAFELFATHSI